MNINIDIDMNYSSAVNKLCLSVIPVKGNEEMLKNVPHKFIEDLAVIYRIEEEGGVSVVVNDMMMKEYGVSNEQLAQDAFRKAPVNHPAVVTPLSTVLGLDDHVSKDNAGSSEGELYIATTDNRFRGAAVIAYPGVLEEAVDIMGGSYYILPSSIHEVLFLSAKTGFGYEELENLVREVNCTTVAENERLSDHVYYYDAGNRTLELAAKHAAPC